MTGGSTTRLSETAVRYAWEELLARAGIPTRTTSRLRLSYGQIAVSGDDAITVFDVIPAPDEAWPALLAAREGALPTVDVATLFPERQVSIAGLRPVLFASHGLSQRSPVQRVGTSVVFHIDIIATTVFMLSRWEETVSSQLDVHGRFPADASVACRHGFLDRPIIDEIAMAVRAWIEVLAPEIELDPLRPSVALSHDIDMLRTARGLSGAMRRLVGDVVKRHSLVTFFRTASQLVREWRDHTASPPWRGVCSLLERSTALGMSGTFFFIAARPSELDGDYSIDSPRVVSLIQELLGAGFEIGLHGGYRTQCDAVELRRQRDALARIVPVRINRQHYLRFRAPDTWRALVQAGIEVDTTLGYAGQEGFRAGTCHPFRVYDIEQDEVLPLVELPLIVMDVTLRSYRKLSPAMAVNRTLELADRCAGVGGTFTLLWHNTSVGTQWRGWENVYGTIVERLSQLGRVTG